ncbi:GIY-YIG nuclease family protein [Candidatus Roizmanbacteria bacterium]|nr:GIY-YIG nuclease family protein [Candidatus Roizmanbacteria bacterium]
MFYYTYILLSKKDNKYYIGSTSNLITRFKFHNQGRVQATKYRRPFVLVYYEACLSKIKAEERERYFKTGFGRGFLKNRI